MNIRTIRWVLIVLSALTLGVTGCGGDTMPATPPSTRAATQTPWIIYVPVTTTPEPTAPPLLPTVAVKAATPTRTPTRGVTPTRPPAVPTKPPAAVTPLVQPSPTAACSIGSVTLTFPENGSYRTKGAAFEMKWIPPAALAGQTDPNIGYKIELESRRGNRVVNGAVVYVSHNKYLRDGKFVYGPREVAGLAAGDNAVVTWKVTIVQATGGFDDTQQRALGEVIHCGPASLPFQIELRGFD